MSQNVRLVDGSRGEQGGGRMVGTALSGRWVMPGVRVLVCIFPEDDTQLWSHDRGRRGTTGNHGQGCTWQGLSKVAKYGLVTSKWTPYGCVTFAPFFFYDNVAFGLRSSSIPVCLALDGSKEKKNCFPFHLFFSVFLSLRACSFPGRVCASGNFVIIYFFQHNLSTCGDRSKGSGPKWNSYSYQKHKNPITLGVRAREARKWNR